MRGHDQPGAASCKCVEKQRRIILESGDPVGIENKRPLAQHQGVTPRFLQIAKSRPEHEGVDPLVGNPVREICGVLNLFQHDGRQMGCVGIQRCGCGGKRHQPGPGFQPRHRRKPCSTRRKRPTREDGKMTALVFMGGGIKRMRHSRPKMRPVFAKPAGMAEKNTLGYADIADLHSAAEATAGHQQMAGLSRHEGHGVAGAKTLAQNLAGAPVKPGGQINGDHGKQRLRDSLHHQRNIAGNGTRQAGTKQGIDDDIPGFWPVGLKRLDVAAPLRICKGRVALKMRAVPERMNHNLRTTSKQSSRRDIAVAAIVAGSAQHGKPQRLWIEPERCPPTRPSPPMSSAKNCLCPIARPPGRSRTFRRG